METLVIEPQVEAETPSQRTTRKQSAASRTFRGAASGKDMKAIVSDPTETKPKAPAATKAPNVAPAETGRVYRVGSPAGRIAVLAILLGFGVMGLVAGADGDATFHGGAWGILWFGGCLVGAWGILKSPYILYVGRDWAEFVSLVETRRVPANEIRGIIRKERVGVGYLTLRDQAGVLDHLVIQLSDGSVTLQPGSEEIFKALTRISPAAQVTTEEYDPD